MSTANLGESVAGRDLLACVDWCREGALPGERKASQASSRLCGAAGRKGSTSRCCGNKEGASKYPVATLTIQKRRTQRVDLPRGPRRRKGAQGLGLERDAKI